MSKKWLLVASIILVFIFVLAACQAEPQIVEVTRVVTEQVEVVVTEVVVEQGEEVVVTRVVTEMVEVPAEAEEASAGEAGEGETLRIAMISDIGTTNYWAYGDPDAGVWTSYVIGNYALALFQYGPSRLDWVPQLAADFPSDLEEEGDFWVSTVALKEGMTWSDGTEITAHDVVFTAGVVKGLELAGNWNSNYNPQFLDHIEAIDDYTVKIYYHTKPGLAVHQFGVMLAPIMPQHFWEPVVAPLLEEAATVADLDAEDEDRIAKLEELRQALYQADGTEMPSAWGYVFSQWEQGAFAENVRNENYSWHGEEITLYTNGAFKSVLGDYEFVAYGDPSGDVDHVIEEGPFFNNVIYSAYTQDAAVLALQSGEADILYANEIQTGQLEQLQTNPEISLIENPNNEFRFLGFNFDVAPFDDLAMRRAINCIIDKEFLANNVLQGAAFPAYTPVPPGNAYWYNPDVTVFCQGLSTQERLEESVRILKEAGYSWEVEPSWNEARGGSPERGTVLLMPDGTPMREMRLLAPSAGYDPLRATAGVLAEQWLQDLGIPISAELTNFQNIVDIVFGGAQEWDLFILGWSLTPYPDHVCDFFESDAGFNVLNYSSQTLDELCVEFRASTDLEEARALNFQLQEVLATELPYVYLFTTPKIEAYNGTRIQYAYLERLNGLTGFQQTQLKALK